MNAEQHYSNQRRNDLLERIAEAQERQAQAIEVLAGALLMEYTYDSDKPDFTVEALPAPVCEFCGAPMEPGQDCPARDEGVCRP